MWFTRLPSVPVLDLVAFTGYKYFGLECPRATVHCQCAKTLSGSRKLSSTQCDRKNVGRTHCVGPYKQGGYMLGSHGTGSVYFSQAS